MSKRPIGRTYGRRKGGGSIPSFVKTSPAPSTPVCQPSSPVFPAHGRTVDPYLFEFDTEEESKEKPDSPKKPKAKFNVRTTSKKASVGITDSGMKGRPPKFAGGYKSKSKDSETSTSEAMEQSTLFNYGVSNVDTAARDSGIDPFHRMVTRSRSASESSYNGADDDDDDEKSSVKSASSRSSRTSKSSTSNKKSSSSTSVNFNSRPRYLTRLRSAELSDTDEVASKEPEQTNLKVSSFTELEGDYNVSNSFDDDADATLTNNFSGMSQDSQQPNYSGRQYMSSNLTSQITGSPVHEGDSLTGIESPPILAQYSNFNKSDLLSQNSSQKCSTHSIDTNSDSRLSDPSVNKKRPGVSVPEFSRCDSGGAADTFGVTAQESVFDMPGSDDEEQSQSQEKISDAPKATKRSSFFSSSQDRESRRKKLGIGGSKKAMYMSYLKSWNDDHEEEGETTSKEIPSQSGSSSTSRYGQSSHSSTSHDRGHEDEGKFAKPMKVTHRTNWPTRIGEKATTSMLIDRPHKQLFTVVRNVKEAHECHEQGESQQFDDDLEYLLDGIKNPSTISTRCLSCVSLARKCAAPSFRMHLRAHGTISVIFESLHDACTSQSLSLCTAALMYMLSRDRLNMDINRQCLHLMVQILDSGSSTSLTDSPSSSHSSPIRSPRGRPDAMNASEAREYASLKEKIADICQPVANKRRPGESNAEWEVSAPFFAMESLLSLTSRKEAGDWFKEELRILGGIDHIVSAVMEVIDSVDLSEGPTPSQLEKFSRLVRSLRVLESVTLQNKENQNYLISIKSSSLVLSLCRALSVCEGELNEMRPEQSDSPILHLLLSVLKLLLNMTNENEKGSSLIGSQSGLVDDILSCMFQAPVRLPQDQLYEIHVVSLCLLINLMEHSKENRKQLMTVSTTYYIPATAGQLFPTMKPMPAVNALVQLFAKRRAAADRIEAENVEEGEGKSGSSVAGFGGGEGSQEKGGADESVTEILHKAGRHMEDSAISFYVSLLLGCVMQGCEDRAAVVGKHLTPGGKTLEPIIISLTKFLDFLRMAVFGNNSGGSSIANILGAVKVLDYQLKNEVPLQL